MSANLAPVGNGVQFFTSQGVVLSGGKINTYVAGSTTRAATFTDSTQAVQNANPIILGANGMSPNPIWLSAGSQYKFVITDANNNIIPGGTLDNLTGVNDVSSSASEWIASGVTPTYVSPSSFSVPGDKTLIYTAGRRIQAAVSAGTVYGSVQSSSFSAGITTVTVVMDVTALDNGLTSVNVGLLNATNPSVPAILTLRAITVGTATITNYANPAAERAALGVGIRTALSGLTMSTPGSSTTMSIAAGEAADSTNSQVMVLAAAISKTTSAWAVGTGNGCLDTGVIANNTGYHFYQIKRTDTGVVDVIGSTSAITPALPANYSLFRRIGWGKTDGSGNWTPFIQDGDYFQWVTAPFDSSATDPGTAAVSRTLSVPSGVNVLAYVNYSLRNTGGVDWTYLLISDLAVEDRLPAIPASDTAGVLSAAGYVKEDGGNKLVRTNTSAQIRSRIFYSDANISVSFRTLGWFDRRGKDA